MEASEWIEALQSLYSGVKNPLSNLANTAAFLWQVLPQINWAGFYLLDDGALWLGPFQGKTACTSIALDRGVCGAAFSRDETIVAPDVHLFPGHIACDAASRSEIVIPLHAGDRAVGVLDVDSPILGRFTEADRMFLENVVRLIEKNCDFSRCGYSLGMDLKDNNA